MSLGSILAGTPCLGNACIPGVSLDANTQTAGAIVMIIIVLGLAWYGNKKWRGTEMMTGAAPA